MSVKRFGLMCLAALAIAACAQADTLTLNPAADTWVRNNDTTAHGSDTFMYVADTAYAYAYMRFDLASFGVTDISSATLTMVTSGGGPRNDNVVTARFNLYGLNNVAGNTPQGWDEAVLTSTNVGAEWTTNKHPLVNVTDLTATVTGITETIAYMPGFTTYGAGAQKITITGGPLVQFLKARLADGGLATLVVDFGASAGGRGYSLGSKENATVAWRPVLTLTATTAPKTAASNPKPADGATDVSRDTVLGWSPSVFPSMHTVYFGTNINDVNTGSANARVSQGQDANTYDPPVSLAYRQTYYWRVDEVNTSADKTLTKGAVWSFTVEPVAYPIASVTAVASSSDSGKGPENTVNKSGLDTTGLLHGTTDTTMWLSSKTGAQPTWIQFNFNRLYKLTDMWVWNYNHEFEQLLGIGIKNAKIEYSADGTTWTTLGDRDFAQATASDGYAHNTTISFGGVAAKSVKVTVNSSFGTSGQYGLSEVRFFYIPVLPLTPQPTDGATGITPDVTLGWKAGREAVSHNVYMGTDPNVLTLAGTAAASSFAPAGLSLGTKYYWRVDEVNTAEAITTWAGDVWNFTTNAFLIVDDMEAYNDSTNKMYDVWIDGYDTTTNGSQVGVDNSLTTGTFGSTTILHGGKQSMPLTYGKNGLTNSEATRTFAVAQDWTQYGVKTLTLYFYGQATNTTTVPLWVKLTDQNGKSAKVAFEHAAGEDPLVLADPAWTTWNIPLSSFSGITLSKVKSMTIGLGVGAGTGTLYIDDIRLYPPTTATVVTPTLVGWWKLDNDVKDSTANGNDGTITGAPTYDAAGKIGAAIKLNGTADYVDCGAGASLNITDQVTLSAWIKPITLANSAYQTFVGKGDHAYCIHQTSGNQLQFYVYDGTWYSAGYTVTSTINGAWHHVAGTYDGSQLRLYLDGKIVANTLRTGVIATTTFSVSIGRNSEQASRLYNGTIDEVRIYRGALPTSEIVKLANP